MRAVMSNSLPAPLPISAIAGVTSPTMMSGMRNERKWLKMLLKVTNTLTAHSGKNVPHVTPRIMAMMTRGNRPILDSFKS